MAARTEGVQKHPFCIFRSAFLNIRSRLLPTSCQSTSRTASVAVSGDFITLSEIRATAIAPALSLLPARMTSPAAEVMLLAIRLQESLLLYRRQIGGPARGLWLFEQGGGVCDVLRHPLSCAHALVVCQARSRARQPSMPRLSITMCRPRPLPGCCCGLIRRRCRRWGRSARPGICICGPGVPASRTGRTGIGCMRKR